MGARPIGCVLGMALPRLDEPWLAAFADGFHALAAVHGCPLIGGDTTRSAHDLAISVTVFGAVPAELALRRDGARADDDIWVSGELGAADVAYRLLDGQYPADPQRLAATRRALEWPEPQVALGMALRGVARSAIDISDGLLQDLGHILAASRVGAALDYASLPVATALDGMPEDQRLRAILGGGDVYQLCFTAPAARRDEVSRAALGRRRASRASAAPRRSRTHGAGCARPAHGRAAARLRSLPGGLSRHPLDIGRHHACQRLPFPPCASAGGQPIHAGLGLSRSGAADRLRAGQRPDPPGLGHLGHRAGLDHLVRRRAATDLMIGVFLALAFVWLLGL